MFGAFCVVYQATTKERRRFVLILNKSAWKFLVSSTRDSERARSLFWNGGRALERVLHRRSEEQTRLPREEMVGPVMKEVLLGMDTNGSVLWWSRVNIKTSGKGCCYCRCIWEVMAASGPFALIVLAGQSYWGAE